MTETEETIIRTVRVFSWSEVDAGLTRALLVAAYRANGQEAEVTELTKLSPTALAAQGERSLGRPLAAEHMRTPGVVDILLTRWLPTLSVDDLDELIWDIQLSLSGPDRSAAPRTKAARLEFVRGRRKTKNMLNNLRAAFLSAHKMSREVTRKGAGQRDQLVFPRELVGVAKPPKDPYPHQVRAWTALDALAASTRTRRAGLLVLPTGSGKTFTVVHWLLRQLEKDPTLRVLWLADQQELLEQAAEHFERDAATMPADFVRRLRVIHSAAGPVTALADEDLDVACVTRQSLVAGGASAVLKDRLAAFLSRPTMVVVDEAHHTVATTYHQLLESIEHIAPRTMLLGLTATPWPSGQGMIHRLNEQFPTTLITVDTLQLVHEEILAQPVVHTVETGEYVRLEASERTLIAKSDFPASILTRLDQEGRNNLVVSTWTKRSDQWGKTLVFAGTIAHADHLGEVFTAAGVRCLVLHSESERSRRSVLGAFREAHEPLVLVSVGMLLEGVDLPDARTAVLARPTLSRVLMRQMIGRVLRGPRAGGDAVAHIVALEDHWLDGIDVLSPVDIGDVTRPEIDVDTPTGVHRLPPIMDEATGEPISEDVLRRIQRAYGELEAHPTVVVGDATLTGYYQLSDVNVPVFEHTLDTWRELIAGKLAGTKLALHSARDLFGDLAVPRPTSQDVNAVVEYISSTGLEPPLVELKSTFSMRSVAQRLIDGPARTEREKIDWQRTEYESTLARSVYPSFQSFAETLHQEVLALSGQVPTAANPENPRAHEAESKLPKIRRSTKRLIEPLLKATVIDGRGLLVDAGEEQYAEILDYPPNVQWTRLPVRSTYALWVPRISGKSKGTPVIRVNRVLQAPASQVPDDVLQFLLWHELCHHILPGQGHNAEFYRLLTMWPEFLRLDHELDILHERLDLDLKATVQR